MNDQAKEIMLILQEEGAEVIQAVSKCMRFGPDQIKPNKEVSNIGMLEEEIGDFLAMVELLTDMNIGVTTEGLTQAKKNKFEKLKLWSTVVINK
jgi:NTP pyrophosphatase (non-canonical NTP hydrolase)